MCDLVWQSGSGINVTVYEAREGRTYLVLLHGDDARVVHCTIADAMVLGMYSTCEDATTGEYLISTEGYFGDDDSFYLNVETWLPEEVGVEVWHQQTLVGGPVASGPLDYEVFREASPDGCHGEAVSAGVVVHLEEHGGRLSIEDP